MTTQNGPIEVRSGGAFSERIKLILAGLVALAGMVGYYYFSHVSEGIRIAGLLGAFGLALVFLATSQSGRTLWGFVQESRVELRKVIWPTRKETTDTTLFVLVMVIVLALLLWVIDLGLDFGIKLLTGRAG
ncbi:SecE subunit of protein translocation complex [mine drainage metagenome]|uniref:SecE subunit of protein translocation complex n=1 Tax=mine drainage metagenome TaxID=410659 RepID=T1CWM9_9ZZZZ